MNKSGKADTDTARPLPTNDDALDTSSTSSTSGGSCHFQEHWLKLFAWIVHADGKMFCISCKRVCARNSLTSGRANFKTSAIKDHMKTSDHINALKVPGLQINKTRVEAALLSKKKAAGHAVRAMHWIIQEDIPIAKYPTLMELLRQYEVQDIRELNVTSQVTYSSRHTATDLLQVFSEQVDEEALQQLTESPFIAVLAEETTDITTKKTVRLYVKTADKILKVKTRFLTNVQLNSGSGQAIADAIEKEMNSRGISPERIRAVLLKNYYSLRFI